MPRLRHRPRPFASYFAIAFSLLLSLFPSPKARAGETVLLGEKYHMKIWNAKEGLNNRTVNATVQDSRGYLWLATLGGLIRFSGTEFQETRLPQRFKPRGPNIRALVATETGDLILQPTSGSIVRIRGRQTELHPANAFTDGRSPQTMFAASDGSLWIAVESGAVLRWEETKTVWFEPPLDSQADQTKASFAEDKHGAIWIKTSTVFGRYQDGVLHPPPEALNDALIIGESQDGGIIALCPDRIALHSDGVTKTLANQTLWQNDPSQLVKLAQDPYGTIWIAAGQLGLLRCSDGKLQATTNEFPVVNDVFLDREQTVWVSSYGNGLGRIVRRSTTLLDRDDGLAQNVSTSIYKDREGFLWIANANGGLYQLQNERAQKFDLKYEGKDLAVNTLCFDPQKRLWIGNNSGLFSSSFPYRAVEKRQYIEKEVHLVYAARNGDVWFATTFGDFGNSTEPASLGFFQNGNLALLNPSVGYNGQAIETIEEGIQGEIWFGTYDGVLLRYRNKQLEKIHSGSSITDLHFDSEGRLWIATTQNGILLYQDERIQSLPHSTGMPHQYSPSIKEDLSGNIWFGFYRVDKQHLVDTLSGKRNRIWPKYMGLGVEDMDLSFLVNWFPTSQVDGAGRFWFATSRGVLAFDPPMEQPATKPLKVYLDKVSINQQPTPVGQQVSIPYGPHNIVVDFSIPFFGNPKNLKVRNRLLGAGDEWTDLGASRSVRYSALSPGKYDLQIEVATSEGWSGNKLSIPFRVLPAWWQALWFNIVLAIFILLVSTFLIRRWSQKRLRRELARLEQDQALERERNRIARDLHDDLGGGLSALQLLASRIARQSDKSYGPDLLRLAERTRRLNADVHSIVWLFSPGDGTLRNLGELIQRYATELFKGSGIAIEIATPASLPAFPLSPEAQHNLFFAVKETLTNALKHSQAKRVSIDMSCVDSIFHCLIQDDGTGIPLSTLETPSGNGLINIKSRIEEIGGAVEFRSSENYGTVVDMSYKIHRNAKNHR